MSSHAAPTTGAPSPFHVMAKPAGPLCNLDCRYCFYLEKETLFPAQQALRMNPEMLERFITQYLNQQVGPEVVFTWQGGEPTLAGLDFFQQAVELQCRHGGGRRITNALQTNGTLLDDDWGRFLKNHDFLVGISLDGPRPLHDAYRLDKRQQPTFDRVMQGVRVLRRHGVAFNTLTVVHRQNVGHALDVYRFLKECGSRHLQFIPLVERKRNLEARHLGLSLATPPQPGQPDDHSPVTPWSVEPEAYGEFLVTIFDEWVRRDVGSVFVQLFEAALANWMGLEAPICLFRETCGNALALEHNGDLFACDHYVYPRYLLGNVRQTPLRELVHQPRQLAFGQAKRDTLPRYCQTCPVRFACHGECPKHRFMRTPDGEPGLNYLCPAYRRFFTHVDPAMRTMTELIRSGRPASDIVLPHRTVLS